MCGLKLNPYKWEEVIISGDYKLSEVEILYSRFEEKKTEIENVKHKKR